MDKKFDEWNTRKKLMDISESLADFHEREIWWCSIGVNVGSEQNSQASDFSRPVLIVRKFTRDVFWGIPITTKIKNLNFRIRFNLNGIENDLLLLQLRIYDKKRLIRKIGTIPKEDFIRIINAIKGLL
jgi:mRNA interferase MazF